MVLLSNQIQTSFSAWCPEYFWGKTSKVLPLYLNLYWVMGLYVHVYIYKYDIIYHICFFFPYLCLRFDLRSFGTCWQFEKPKASTGDSSHRGVACKTTFTWWHSSYVRGAQPSGVKVVIFRFDVFFPPENSLVCPLKKRPSLKET